MMDFLLLALCVGLAVARFFMPSHPLSVTGSYQAVAHLLVGGLIGAWLVSKEKWTTDKWYGLMALGLSAIELVAFFALRK